MPRVLAACCAAGCALLAPAAGLGDVESLVQVVATKPSALGLSHAPVKGEDGSYVEVKLGKGCKQEECPFAWGDKLDLGVVAHLPTGIHEGDKVHSNFTIGFASIDPSSPLSSLLSGTSVQADTVCDVCEGSCSLLARVGEAWTTAVWPTRLKKEPFCTPDHKPMEKKKEFKLMDMPSLQTPALPAGTPSLSLEMTMGVQRRDGSIRAATTGRVASANRKGPALALLQLVQGHALGPVGALRAVYDAFFPSEPEQAPEQQAAAERAGGGEEGVVSPARAALSLLQAFSEAQVSSEDQAPNKKHGGPNTVDSMVMSLKVNKLEGDNKIAVSSEKGCTTRGSTGYDCKMAFGESFALATSGRLVFDFQRGAKLRVKQSTKGGGLVGMMLTQAVKAAGMGTLELPICGDEASLTLMGKKTTLSAAECGHYEIAWGTPSRKVNMPSVSALKMPTKLPGLDMPLPMTDVSKMKPMSFVTHIEFLHPDGTTMADFELENGFGR